LTKGKGVRVKSQSSFVNEKNDYEKKTRNRKVRLYIPHYLFNSSSLGSCPNENLVVLTSADPFYIFYIFLFFKLTRERVELGYLKLSEHARSDGREQSRQASRVACPAILHLRKSSRSTRGFRSLAKPCPSHTTYPFRDPERRTKRSLCDRLPFSALFLHSGFPVLSYYWYFSSFAFLVFNMSWLTIGWRCHPGF